MSYITGIKSNLNARLHSQCTGVIDVNTFLTEATSNYVFSGNEKVRVNNEFRKQYFGVTASGRFLTGRYV